MTFAFAYCNLQIINIIVVYLFLLMILMSLLHIFTYLIQVVNCIDMLHTELTKCEISSVYMAPVAALSEWVTPNVWIKVIKKLNEYFQKKVHKKSIRADSSCFKKQCIICTPLHFLFSIVLLLTFVIIMNWRGDKMFLFCLNLTIHHKYAFSQVYNRWKMTKMS